MATEFINAKPIEHTCNNGTTFKCERADLGLAVNVEYIFDITEAQKLVDFAEFGAWHSSRIHPQLNGFRGYVGVTYVFNN